MERAELLKKEAISKTKNPVLKVAAPGVSELVEALALLLVDIVSEIEALKGVRHGNEKSSTKEGGTEGGG